MTPATLKTLREFVGLTHQEIADRFGINVRTVERWESVKAGDTSTVRPEVVEWLQGLLAWMNGILGEIIDRLEEAEAEYGDLPDSVDLSRYINATSAENAGLTVPWRTHAACQGYIMAQLASLDVEVRVHYVIPEK